MTKKKQVKSFPRSIKKHIRREKGRIRRNFLSENKREDQIKELYKRFVSQKTKNNKKPKTTDKPKKDKNSSKKTATKKPKKKKKTAKTKNK